MRILFVILIIFLTSCNSERNALKKYSKLKKNHPQLFVSDTIIIDTTITISIRDTFFLPSDSIEGMVPNTDTTITSDKLSIQFWKDKYNGLMHYRADLKPDTIFIDSIIQVPVYLTKQCPERLSDEAIMKNYLSNLIPWWVYLIAALLFSALIYNFFRRK